MVKMITGLFGIHANQLSLLLFFPAFSYFKWNNFGSNNGMLHHSLGGTVIVLCIRSTFMLFYVGPSEDDIFSRHLLSPIFQSSYTLQSQISFVTL